MGVPTYLGLHEIPWWDTNWKNRVYRLMKEHQLLVPKNHRLRAKQSSTRPKPKATQPNQYWGMDMTKIKLNGWGWVYVHVVLDWCTKEIIGTSVSYTSKTSDWLDALNNAVCQRFPNGIHLDSKKPSLITDNGCQPTSTPFMKDCSILGIKQIFTTWNNKRKCRYWACISHHEGRSCMAQRMGFTLSICQWF